MTRPRGRPRGFTTDQAEDAAMRLFWAVGYEGASVDQLCRATGMPRASLYQDYGGKEGLFLAAIARYAVTQTGPLAEALGPRGTLEEDLAAFFAEVVALATRDSRTPGCLVACVLADVAGANERFRKELNARFSALEDRIARRLSHGSDSAAAIDVVPLAGMLAAVARGIMLRARSGAAAGDLQAIGAAAVRSVTARPILSN